MNPVPDAFRPTASVNTARQIIHDNTFLLEREEFTRFLGRWRNEADRLADLILHDNNISDRERENLRRYRLGILAMLKSPHEDTEAQASYLASKGQPRVMLNEPNV
jgi:hypothetical protein